MLGFNNCLYSLQVTLSAAWDEKNKKFYSISQKTLTIALTKSVNGMPEKRKRDVNYNRRQCINMLLSYGTELKGMDFRNFPGADPRLTFPLFVGGIPGFKDTLQAITEYRVRRAKVIAFNTRRRPRQQQQRPTVRDMRSRFQGMRQDPQTEYTWRTLQKHVPFREICNKHHSRKCGTAVPILMESCRDVIRDQLVKCNRQNLFVLVPKVPLPLAIQSFLLYSETLDDE